MKNKMSTITRILYTVLPFIISAILVVVVYFLWIKDAEIDTAKMNDIIGTILGIWGTFFGFVITAVSILIAFNGSKFTEEIRDSGHYQTVMFLYIITCAIIFVAISIFLPIYIVCIESTFILVILIFFTVEIMIMFGIDILLLFLVLKTATQTS